MTFDNTTDDNVFLTGQPAEHDERREKQRRTVLWPAILHIHEHRFHCQIRNFSMSGLKLKLNLPLKSGTMVKVEIPRRNSTLRAKVSWQSDDLLGIHFMEKPDVIQDVFGERAEIMGLTSSHPIEVLCDEASA